MTRRKNSQAQKPCLKVIPLGGLDGIGKNMCVIECGDDIILEDAGLMFPDDAHLGIDYILPDYTYVLENEDRLRAIIITHGHEDHIGALPYLLQDLNPTVPIYATKLTLGFIKGRMEEHKIKNPDFRCIQSGDQLHIGCFDISFFSVNHSIPDALGVFFRSPAGNVLHTGDFKLDQTPIDGVRCDFNLLSSFSQIGVDLLMSDSTNAMRQGFTPSEASVGDTLKRVIASAQGRVFVAAFSSHIHRLQQVCDAARACDRIVAVTGRSMLTNTKIARELGYLSIDEDQIIDAFDINKYPENRIVVLCTGSQGEPLSALARMASGEHKTLEIQCGDTVIISATPVPGNEKAVTQIINQLAKIGADVYDKDRAMVHVSGHASQEELKLMIALTRPKFFMPVHGEASHLRAHAQLAQDMGIEADNIFILENGDTIEISDGQVRMGEPVESGVMYVEGLRIGETDQTFLADRKRLSEDGVVCIDATISRRSNSLIAIQIQARGVSFDATEKAFQSTALERLKKSITKHGSSLETRASCEKLISDNMSSYIWELHHCRPVILVFVVQV